MSSAQKPAATLKSANFWIGIFLGALVAKALDTIPNNLFWFFVITFAVLFPSIWLKDRVSERHAAIRARGRGAAKTRYERHVVGMTWWTIDLVVGSAILFPAVVFALWVYDWLVP